MASYSYGVAVLDFMLINIKVGQRFKTNVYTWSDGALKEKREINRLMTVWLNVVIADYSVDFQEAILGHPTIVKRFSVYNTCTELAELVNPRYLTSPKHSQFPSQTLIVLFCYDSQVVCNYTDKEMKNTY